MKEGKRGSSKTVTQCTTAHIAHLKNDRSKSKHVWFAREETGLSSVVDPEEFRRHPSLGSLEPRSRSFRTVETGDASEPEVIESRTVRLVNENISLRWEMVRYYRLRPSGERNKDGPLSNLHARYLRSVRTTNRGWCRATEVSSALV